MVEISLVQNKSFIAIGIPSNGLAVLVEILLSDSSANLMALSKFILLKEIIDDKEIEEELNVVRKYVDIALKYDPKNELALTGKIELAQLESIDEIEHQNIYDEITNKLLDKVG